MSCIYYALFYLMMHFEPKRLQSGIINNKSVLLNAFTFQICEALVGPNSLQIFGWRVLFENCSSQKSEKLRATYVFELLPEVVHACFVKNKKKTVS